MRNLTLDTAAASIKRFPELIDTVSDVAKTKNLQMDLVKRAALAFKTSHLYNQHINTMNNMQDMCNMQNIAHPMVPTWLLYLRIHYA